MNRIIDVDDIGLVFEVSRYGMCKGPGRYILSKEELFRLYNLHSGPAHIFIVNPDNENERKRITDENVRLEPTEIFKKIPVIPDDINATLNLDDLADREEEKQEKEFVEDIVEPAEQESLMEETEERLQIEETKSIETPKPQENKNKQYTNFKNRRR